MVRREGGGVWRCRGGSGRRTRGSFCRPPSTPPPPPPASDAIFPPLSLALAFLSRLSRVAERGSFEALAQDAVAAVARLLVAAGEARRKAHVGPGDIYMTNRATIVILSDGTSNGAQATSTTGTLTRCLLAAAVSLSPGASWPAAEAAAAHAAVPAATADVDGLLFTVKNLLVLREQISPYALSLASTTQSLDFSSTGDALRVLVSRAGSLLTLSSANPFLTFLQTGMPRVAEARVDVKSTLEDLLRGACEEFIKRSSLMLAGKAESMRGGELSARVLLEGTCGDLVALLPPLRRRLGLYLGSAVTASILFAPIRERVVAAVLVLQRDAVGTSDQISAQAAADACLLALEASDALITDPSSPGFGYDSAVFEARCRARVAVVATAAATGDTN